MIKDMSRKQEGIQQDNQTNFQIGGREASIRIFHQPAETKWLDIVEGSALSEMKEKTAHRVWAID
jgi:hypothetical protein